MDRDTSISMFLAVFSLTVLNRCHYHNQKRPITPIPGGHRSLTIVEHGSVPDLFAAD